jgi:hypothetical protein
MNTPPLPPLAGGCLCGQLRYEATPTHRDGYYCHCRMCQLAFGNTRAAFLNLRKDEVRWMKGAPAYYASSKIARRGFCGQCGTPLSFEYLDSERMDLSVGTLDDPSQLRPTEHFAVESRIAAWHADDGLPGSTLDANPKIMQRWHAAYGDDAQPGLATARAGRTIGSGTAPKKDST